MSLAELRRWTLERSWGDGRRQELEDYLSRYLVIHSEDELCNHWARATDTARSNGRPIASADAWIAATALFLGVPLITHNGRHYAGVDGLQVMRSWLFALCSLPFSAERRLLRPMLGDN